MAIGTMFVLVVAACGGDGGATAEAAERECLPVPQEMLDIMGRNPEVEAKGKYVEGWAVESNEPYRGWREGSTLYFVTMEFDGPGYEGEGDLATFETSFYDGGGGIRMPVNDLANEVEVAKDARTLPNPVFMTHDGATESQECFAKAP